MKFIKLKTAVLIILCAVEIFSVPARCFEASEPQLNSVRLRKGGQTLLWCDSAGKQPLMLAPIALISMVSPFMAADDNPGFVLVKEAKARSVIVLPNRTNHNTLDAATALQKVVKQMAGVELAIRTVGESLGGLSPVYVGMSPLVRELGVDLVQDADGDDHYVVHVDSKRIVLAGNDSNRFRGSVFAVYDLLQRLGCGWYGPDPVFHVIPHRPTLALAPFKSDERPAFRHRDIWMVKDPTLRDAWRLGGCRLSSGHALDRWLPPKQYAVDHPDYFGPDQKQPCLSHPEVLAIIVKQCRAELDRNQGLQSFSLSANDSKVYCECDRCKSVGNISTRMLSLANGVARELAKTHPKRYRLTFLAYWLAHDSPQPMLKAEPGVCVMQVNEGDRMRPWDQPDPAEYQSLNGNDNNYRELVAFSGWKQSGAELAIYEWWIPGCSKEEWKSIPWYSGETALRNLRYWKRNDVRFITYESGYEKRNGFPIRWPLYYVGARGLWNPELSSKQIMTEACERLYGSAGRPMLRFYEMIEKAVADAPPKLRGYAWNLPKAEKIYLPPVEAQATSALAEAAAIATDAAVLARIGQERSMWDDAQAAIAKARQNKTSEQKPNDVYKN